LSIIFEKVVIGINDNTQTKLEATILCTMQTIARIQRDWRQMNQGHPGSGGFCFLSKHEIVIRKLMIMIAAMLLNRS
jgi:hypothetical protein